jgi:hypothetical protein
LTSAHIPAKWPPVRRQEYAPAGDVSRIVEEPGFRRRMFFERGVEPAPERLADFARFIGQDRKVAARIVAQSGLQPQ